MKKLTFALLLLALGGCLSTTTHNPYEDNRSTEEPWWNAGYYHSTVDSESPWMKFVPEPVSNGLWHDLWGQDDLERNYGVNILPGYKAPALPAPALPDPPMSEQELDPLSEPLK